MNECENNELNKNENISVKKMSQDNGNDNANINNEMEKDLNCNNKSKIKNLKLEKLIKIKVQEDSNKMKPYIKTSPNKYTIINKKIINPNKNYKIYKKKFENISEYFNHNNNLFNEYELLYRENPYNSYFLTLMNYERRMNQMNLLNNNHPNIITNSNNYYYSYNSHLNDSPFNTQMSINNNNANINSLFNRNLIGNNNDKFYINRFPNYINNNNNYFRNKYFNEYENNIFPNIYFMRNILLKEKYFLNNEFFMNNWYNNALIFNKRNLIRDFSSDFLFHRSRYDSHQILSQNANNLKSPSFLPPPFKKRAYSHGRPFNVIQKYYDDNFIMEEEDEEEGNNDDNKEGKIKNFKNEVNNKNIKNNEEKDLNNSLNDSEKQENVDSKIKNDIPYKKINYENYNNYRYYNPYYNLYDQFFNSRNIKSKSKEFINQYKNINNKDNDIFFFPRNNNSRYFKNCFNLKNLIYSKKNISTKSLINKKSNKIINSVDNKNINNSVNVTENLKENQNINDISIKKELENNMKDKIKRIRMSEDNNGKRDVKEIKLFKTKSEINISKGKILKDETFGKQIKNDGNKNSKKSDSHKGKIMSFQYIPSKEIIFTNSMYNIKTQFDNSHKTSKEKTLSSEKLKKIKTFIPSKKINLKTNKSSQTYSKINVNNENIKKLNSENTKKNRITFNDNIKIINLENKMNNSTEKSKLKRIKSLQSLYNIIFTKKNKKIDDNKNAFDINKNKSINISKKLYSNCGEKKTNRIIWNINKKLKNNKSIENDKDKNNIIKNKILIGSSLRKLNNSGDNIKPKNVINIKFNTINKNIKCNKNNDESYTNQYIQKTLSKVGNQKIKAKTQKSSFKNSKAKISKKANANNSNFKKIKNKFKKININIDNKITINEFPSIKTLEHLNKSQIKKNNHFLFNINSSKQLKDNKHYFKTLMINDSSNTASDSDLLSKNRKSQNIENIKNKKSKIYIINKNNTEMKKKNNIIRNSKKKLDINELNIVTTIEVECSKMKDNGRISKEKNKTNK